MAARFERQQSAIFVVGMRHNLHQSRRCTKPQQFEAQSIDAFILRDWAGNPLISKSRRLGQNVIFGDLSLRRPPN